MIQRVFVNVVGFTDVERHALNSVFRLSEEQDTAYSLWEPQAPSPPELTLIDGQSARAGVELELSREADIPVVWIGPHPPRLAIRSFDRPIPWSEVVHAMDDLVGPLSGPVDVDLDVGLGAVDFDFDDIDTLPPDPHALRAPPSRRALIVNADRHERLYLRARLALARLCEADEAETAAQALELARDNEYVLAVADFNLPDADGWTLFKELGEGKRPIGKVILTKSRPSIGERIHARIAGVTGLFEKPPHPAKLHELLMKL
jgi:CheY-like chemotaxis protein